MKNLFVILLLGIVFTSCMNNSLSGKTRAQLMRDTLIKPPYVPASATLLNLGSSDEPIFAWVELVGPLNKNGQIYSHILELRYYFTSGIKQTSYYENLKIRESNKAIDFNDFKPLGFPFSGNIKIASKKDNLLLFEVLVKQDIEVKDNVYFINVGSIKRKSNGKLLATQDVQCNLAEDGNGYFSLTLIDGAKIKYRLSPSYKISSKMISFINRENGYIYLLDKTVFLQPVDSNDVSKLSGND